MSEERIAEDSIRDFVFRNIMHYFNNFSGKKESLMCRKDYSFRFFISNFTCFLIVYAICLYVCFNLLDTTFLKIISIIALYFICSRLELKYLCYYVNFLVVLTLPQGIREKEMKLLKQSRDNDKRNRGRV